MTVRIPETIIKFDHQRTYFLNVEKPTKNLLFLFPKTSLEPRQSERSSNIMKNCLLCNGLVHSQQAAYNFGHSNKQTKSKTTLFSI